MSGLEKIKFQNCVPIKPAEYVTSQKFMVCSWYQPRPRPRILLAAAPLILRPLK